LLDIKGVYIDYKQLTTEISIWFSIGRRFTYRRHDAEIIEPKYEKLNRG